MHFASPRITPMTNLWRLRKCPGSMAVLRSPLWSAGRPQPSMGSYKIDFPDVREGAMVSYRCMDGGLGSTRSTSQWNPSMKEAGPYRSVYFRLG